MPATATATKPDFHDPGIYNCSRSDCPHLKTVSYYKDNQGNIIYRKVCGLVGKIPGRLVKCPLEECDN